jgi:hypothetical protein
MSGKQEAESLRADIDAIVDQSLDIRELPVAKLVRLADRSQPARPSQERLRSIERDLAKSPFCTSED